MLLVEEKPDFEYVLRGADGASARVNERTLSASFILSPDTLLEDWPAGPAAALDAEAMAPLLALGPEVVILGTGDRQHFPAAAMAACLQRGIGIECMGNAAAARTYNVLAGEGRRVVAAFLLG